MSEDITVPTIDELEIIPLYQCQEGCDLTGDTPEGPLYECGNCGNVFTRAASANYNHQCPDCNKFAAKIADMGCDICERGEVVETSGIVCPNCLEDIEIASATPEGQAREWAEHTTVCYGVPA